jgi:hypothetical protein
LRGTVVDDQLKGDSKQRFHKMKLLLWKLGDVCCLHNDLWVGKSFYAGRIDSRRTVQEVFRREYS